MNKLPLEGVRIITVEDFLALPWGTRLLADLGAEVILVQSHKRVGKRIAEAADQLAFLVKVFGL